jgi:AcrR family transcriptional regulator
VGTFYQYYPNKQSLLFAVLESHMNKMAEAVERACKRTRGKPTAEVVREVVEAFVDAKMERTDISTALYRIAAEIDGPAVARRAFQRSMKALEAALKTAPNAASAHDRFAIQMMFGAMAGTTKSVLEAGAPTAMVGNLRHHLVQLCQSYMAATAKARSR